MTKESFSISYIERVENVLEKSLDTRIYFKYLELVNSYYLLYEEHVEMLAIEIYAYDLFSESIKERYVKSYEGRLEEYSHMIEIVNSRSEFDFDDFDD